MIDWTKTMTQTFEFYTVDPYTWKDKARLTNITGGSCQFDETSDTISSATIDAVNDLGEEYIRVYIIAQQMNEDKLLETAKVPVGTWLVQTPRSKFDGKVRTISMDAYSPLIELKEKSPEIGYFIPKNSNIMDIAYRLLRENTRTPIVQASSSETLYSDFISDPNDNWITFGSDLISNAKFKFGLDELGRILFVPIQDIASLQPVFYYNDDNSSILYSDIDIEHDLYNIPNVVEVIYSDNYDTFYAKAINDDPNSPLSTVSRGREIKRRITNLDMIGNPTNKQIQQYAEQTLRNLSTFEFTVTYSHGYNPRIRVGDCVMLNYKRAGLDGVKAKVISQSFSFDKAIKVTEKAVFTSKLWR